MVSMVVEVVRGGSVHVFAQNSRPVLGQCVLLLCSVLCPGGLTISALEATD